MALPAGVEESDRSSGKLGTTSALRSGVAFGGEGGSSRAEGEQTTMCKTQSRCKDDIEVATGAAATPVALALKWKCHRARIDVLAHQSTTLPQDAEMEYVRPQALLCGLPEVA